ncbi:MAG: hypothetical protein M1818_004071 [Claussenomyces sp. TS43310]|nr:MAG: hypothetical protein M1818_004071 [Claussenomyces sp. TS43310]
MGDSKTTPKVKASPAPGAKSKKAPKSLVVTLNISPKSLLRFASAGAKAEPESKAPSSTSSNPPPNATSSPGENNSESNSNTPAPSSAGDASSMPPPVDSLKKEKKAGVKRSSATNDGLLKPRGKPGPKKRAKIEDGTTPDPVSGFAKPAAINATAAHKLGPKANQGAINAGLRALDRSGKPCRKWQKGGFQLKTFTGVVWEIPRWRAPSKVALNGQSEESSSGDSSKENKDSSRVDSEKSTSAADIEMGSSLSMPASSPAPAILATA